MAKLCDVPGGTCDAGRYATRRRNRSQAGNRCGTRLFGLFSVAGAPGIARSPAFVFFDLNGNQRYLHARPIFDAGAMISFARCMADGIYERTDVEKSLRGG